MDFILEHNDDPIPELGVQAFASTMTDVPMDEDDDEAALREAMGKASANVESSPADVEARVCAQLASSKMAS